MKERQFKCGNCGEGVKTPYGSGKCGTECHSHNMQCDDASAHCQGKSNCRCKV